MGYRMTDEPLDLNDLLARSLAGDDDALQRLLESYRDRLRRMVQYRLDQRIQARIDASDVLQEAYVEAWQRIADYRRQPSLPFFLWLRFLVVQRLTTLHRQHLGVLARDVTREVSIYSGPLPAASSMALAAQLVGQLTTPSEAAMRVKRISTSRKP